MNRQDEHAVYTRHAACYLRKLAAIGEQYQQGRDNVIPALKVFDECRPQIELAHQRLVDDKEADENSITMRVDFCTVSPAVLLVRLTPGEYIRWLDQAFTDITRIRNIRPVVEINLLHSYGRLHMDTGRHDIAQSSLERAQAIAEKHQLAESLAGLYGDLELLALHRGRLSTVLNARKGSTEDASDNRLSATLNHIQALTMDKHFEEALALLEPRLAQARENDPPEDIANLIIVLGNIRNRTEDYDGALACGQEALAIARALNHKTLICDGLNVIAVANTRCERFDEGLTCFRQIIPLASELGDQNMVAIVYLNMGVALTNKGEFEEALACFDQSRTIFAGMGLEHMVRTVALQRWRSRMLSLPPFRILTRITRRFYVLKIFTGPIMKRVARAWLNWRERRSYK